MNALFIIFCISSIIILIFTAPEKVLESMLFGITKAINLTLSLVGIYCVWMGIFQLLESSGITDKLAKLLKKPIEKLFGKNDEKTQKAITMNISANIFGLGGIATPLGIEACSRLEQQGKDSEKGLLVVIAATSLQILPTSVIALAVKHGSKNPAHIILPSLLSTIVSSFCGIFLYKLYQKFQNKKSKRQKNEMTLKNSSKPTTENQMYKTNKSNVKIETAPKKSAKPTTENQLHNINKSNVKSDKPLNDKVINAKIISAKSPDFPRSKKL